MPFDPDKYLSEKSALVQAVQQNTPSSNEPVPSFDPDKFLNDKIEANKSQGDLGVPKVSAMKAAGMGALQGGSMGYADELEAALKSGHISGPEYQGLRDKIRAEYHNASSQHPIAFGAGGVGGGMLSGGAAMLAAPALAGVGGAVALGAASGLGTSDADLTNPSMENLKQAGIDTAEGAGIGLLTGGAVKGLGMLAKTPIPKAMGEGLEYGAAGNKPTQEAMEQALNTIGTKKGNIIEQATAEGQRIPINDLVPEIEQGMAKLPKSMGSKEQASREELQKILSDAGLTPEQVQAIPETAPEGLIPQISSKSTPESMSPSDLSSLQKALQSLGFKDKELTGTQGAQLAKRLYGKAGEPLKEALPEVGALNKEAQQHMNMQDLTKEFNIGDIFSSPGKLLKKYPAQAGGYAGYAASKVPGAVSAAKGAAEVGKAVGETLPISSQTIRPEDIRKTDTAALSRNLYNMPMDELSPYADRLEQAGGFKDQASHLKKAIEEGNSLKKNQALFLLMQDPKSRAIMRGE